MSVHAQPLALRWGPHTQLGVHLGALGWLPRKKMPIRAFIGRIPLGLGLRCKTRGPPSSPATLRRRLRNLHRGSKRSIFFFLFFSPLLLFIYLSFPFPHARFVRLDLRRQNCHPTAVDL